MRRLHAERDTHPIIRSLEPGEEWSWCFLDEVAFVVPEVRGMHPHTSLADGVVLLDAGVRALVHPSADGRAA